ncbi:hypothetical protein ABKN59_001229 [Abortiporus biennis]
MSTLSSYPELLQPDDRSAADQARAKLKKRRSFISKIFTRSKKPTPSVDLEQEPDAIQEWPMMTETEDQSQLDLVHIEDHYLDAVLDENYDKDVYRWAVLFENQRGATIFSTPYYSPLSLLPMDPPPFTIPTASPYPRHCQPTVSLFSYPLPDGDWRWVSKCWMVDMRGDGLTQFDGFEYNWYFRSKNWRVEVGRLNAGGWVRRRRWIRLMVRPAKIHHVHNHQESGKSTPSNILHLEHSQGGTRPPSVVITDSGDEEPDITEVWRGEGEEDWKRCRVAMRRLGRDGRKLELWRRWLEPSTVEPASIGSPTNVVGQQPKKQWSEDSTLLPSQRGPIPHHKLEKNAGVRTDKAPKEHIASVLRCHGKDIFESFLYPDSRSRFLEMLNQTGLLSEVEVEGPPQSLQLLDFWSYASSFDNLHVIHEEDS